MRKPSYLLLPPWFRKEGQTRGRSRWFVHNAGWVLGEMLRQEGCQISGTSWDGGACRWGDPRGVSRELGSRDLAKKLGEGTGGKVDQP